MAKNKVKFKNVRIERRTSGDIVRIRLISCYDNHHVFFEGEAPMNDEKKVETLLRAAERKGLKMPNGNEENKWFS